MAKKSANIMVRVEPEVKAKAEAVMNELGVPASVVVNMLYKHIIRTGGIPFSVNISENIPETEEGSCIYHSETSETPIDNGGLAVSEDSSIDSTENLQKNIVEEIVDIPGLNAPSGAKKIITVI